MLGTLGIACSLLVAVAASVEWWRSSSSLEAFYWTDYSRRLYVITFWDGHVSAETIANWPNREMALFDRGEVNVGPIIWPDEYSRRLQFGMLGFSYRSGLAHGILHADGTTWYGLLNNQDPRAFGPESPFVNVSLALWPLIVLGAIVPAWRFVGWLRRRPARPRPPAIRRCHACGYNLTGNTSGVCPECGTAVISGSISRRMGRRFTMAAASSSLLCVAMIAVWLVSSRWNLSCQLQTMHPSGSGWHVYQWVIGNGPNGVVLARFDGGVSPFKPDGLERWHFAARRSSGAADSLGLWPKWETSFFIGIPINTLYVPYWCLLIPALALPIAWGVRRIRRGP